MPSQHSRHLLKVHTEKNLPLHFSCVWPWASNLVSMSQISIDDHNFLYCPQMRYLWVLQKTESAMQMETSNKLVIWLLAFYNQERIIWVHFLDCSYVEILVLVKSRNLQEQLNCGKTNQWILIRLCEFSISEPFVLFWLLLKLMRSGFSSLNSFPFTM